MKITPYLDTRVERKSGLYPVYIRISHRERQKLVETGYKIEPHHWAKNRVSNKHPNAKIINSKINEIVSQAERYEADCLLHNKPINIDHFGKGEHSQSFQQYLQHRAKQYGASDQPQMETKLKRHIKELNASLGDVRFDQVNQDRLRDHEAYLKSIGNNANTREKKYQTLREIYGAAIEDGRAVAPNPFKIYNIQTKPVKKEKLTMEELKKIEELQLKGPAELARDIFLFQFYTKGQRIATAITIPKSAIHKDRIEIKTNKGEKHISVKIHSKLKVIIDKYPKGKYLFNLITELPKTKKELISIIGSRTAVINRDLKTVQAFAEIKKKLTTHIARHTFAYLLKHTASSFGVIQDALGHSDSRTTEKYLKSLGDEVLDKEMEKIYGE